MNSKGPAGEPPVPGTRSTAARRGHGRWSLVRLLEAIRTRRTFSVEDKSPQPGETSYYVRVTQADGHQAWSSPIWVEASRH